MSYLSKQAILYAYHRKTGNKWKYSAAELDNYFKSQEYFVQKTALNAAGDKPWTYSKWRKAKEAVGNFFRMTLAKLSDKMNADVSFSMEEVAETEFKKWLTHHPNPRTKESS